MFKSIQRLTIVPIATLVLLLGCSNVNSANESTNASPSTPATTTATPTATLSETLIVPGERVGPVTPNTTRQDLAELFGEANLTDEEVNIGEGFTEPATRVKLEPEKSFSVVWADTNRTQPVEVRNLGREWQTPQGIGVGTPLSQLQETLGEFQLYGFAWDYGGTVVLEGTELAQYEDSLILRLQTAPNAAEKSPDDFQAVAGDDTFSSTNPHLQALDVEVGEIIVRLVPMGSE
jgi:hypothetical protein